jgi:hypothetical protein
VGVVISDDELSQEVEMSKRNETPNTPVATPRLIRVGGAKARTNAGGGEKFAEEFPRTDRYDANGSDGGRRAHGRRPPNRHDHDNLSASACACGAYR